MKVLCIHFKGGVGKSTTAIHITGVLQSDGPTLLVDGDRQVTSYRFFNGGNPPANENVTDAGGEITIIPLHSSEPLQGHNLSKRIQRILKIPHKHLVVDTTPDPAVSNQIISEFEPDLVLIPVKHDDFGGHVQLTPLLETLSRMRAIGIRPWIKIIPLGSDASTILPYADGIDLEFEITETIPSDPVLFGMAVYDLYDFAWNLPGGSDTHRIYNTIVF